VPEPPPVRAFLTARSQIHGFSDEFPAGALGLAVLATHSRRRARRRAGLRAGLLSGAGMSVPAVRAHVLTLRGGRIEQVTAFIARSAEPAEQGHADYPDHEVDTPLRDQAAP